MKLDTIRGTRHQVLVGLFLWGAYECYPHTIRSTWEFYRAMVADGLVTEEDLGGGRSRFSAVPETMPEVLAESERVRARLMGGGR